MHRCSTILLHLFFIIHVHSFLMSMGLPLVDFKRKYRKKLIKECKKYGFNYDEQKTTNDAISQVFKITKQRNKNKNDHEIYTLIKKQAPHFVAQQLAFEYMATQGIPDDALSHITRYLYEDYICPPILPLLNYTLYGRTDINALELNSDGTMLYIGFDDGTIKEWNIATQKQQNKFIAHIDSITCLALTKDGKSLYSSGTQGPIKIWSLPALTQVTLPDSIHMIYDMILSPNQTTLYAGSWDKTIKACTLKKPFCATSYSIEANSLCLSPNERLLYAATDNDGIRVVDTLLKQELAPLAGTQNYIRNIVISGDGKTLYSGSEDLIKVWDLQTRKEHACIYHEYIGKIALSLDGTTLYCCTSSNYGILVLDTKTGTTLCTLEGHTDCVNALVVSPDGNTLYSGSDDGTLNIWDLNKNVPIVHSQDWRLMLYKSFLINNQS